MKVYIIYCSLTDKTEGVFKSWNAANDFMIKNFIERKYIFIEEHEVLGE